ncbi:hypothetical protein B0H15DRAFT_946144 [Mycena belliarum]|uniref:Uncharacterized protein n=1 Tax=Mycena belliarum TaxID=1033014 RepID=A0AAD6UH06_9AGAR|nr:hypothetical protein B0H15DRAFT_946144 [Mycena belliae]
MSVWGFIAAHGGIIKTLLPHLLPLGTAEAPLNGCMPQGTELLRRMHRAEHRKPRLHDTKVLLRRHLSVSLLRVPQSDDAPYTAVDVCTLVAQWFAPPKKSPVRFRSPPCISAVRALAPLRAAEPSLSELREHGHSAPFSDLSPSSVQRPRKTHVPRLLRAILCHPFLQVPPRHSCPLNIELFLIHRAHLLQSAGSVGPTSRRDGPSFASSRAVVTPQMRIQVVLFALSHQAYRGPCSRSPACRRAQSSPRAATTLAGIRSASKAARYFRRRRYPLAQEPVFSRL